MTRTFARNVYELFSSMRFAISLLTLLAIASVVGTVLKQNEPYNAYLNQFGPFWFPIFEKLGLYGVYHATWFLVVLVFLVVSTSLCIVRQAPQMLKEMKGFREHAKESSLRQFAHHASLRVASNLEAAQKRVTDYLRGEGYALRTVPREDGVLIAAKAGSWNRLGYLLAHGSIVLICVGGLLDGDMPLKLQLMMGDRTLAPGNALLSSIKPENRLPASHWSYRGNVFLPEGQRSGTAVLNVNDGILLQELPFDLQLKKFYVDFYSTGMPKRFASDVVVIDRETGQQFERTIEVNKPIEYKGVTLYQASFDDGGSKLKFKAHSLSAGSNESLPLDGVVGESVKLTRRGTPLSLEVTAFRPMNVENTGDAKKQTGTMDKLSSHLGSAAKAGGKKELQNVGPSMTFKLRDAAGQAREFHSYMQPIMQDGRPYFITGVREATADNFRYMRIPAVDGKLDTWLQLRAVLTDPTQRNAIARRFTAVAMKGDAISETMRSKLTATAENTLALFAKGGYDAMDEFIRSQIAKEEQQKAAEVFIKVLQGTAWEAWQMARAQAKQPPAPMNEQSAAFITDALNAVADTFHYKSPFLLELTDFQQIQASVIQATRSPGRNIVYLGCALLVAGVCFMLYVRERRVFVLLKQDGEALLAMSANRKTLELDEAFARHSAALQATLEHDVTA
ncbi:MAG TPA: cytochrome c biogenesis protein ResB [Rhodocyclaceae bacterium]|nr:cytochrome c biogenesis protein ResB [Rhodocyclaceae bacterium]